MVADVREELDRPAVIDAARVGIAVAPVVLGQIADGGFDAGAALVAEERERPDLGDPARARLSTATPFSTGAPRCGEHTTCRTWSAVYPNSSESLLPCRIVVVTPCSGQPRVLGPAQSVHEHRKARRRAGNARDISCGSAAPSGCPADSASRSPTAALTAASAKLPRGVAPIAAQIGRGAVVRRSRSTDRATRARSSAVSTPIGRLLSSTTMAMLPR
jgi:hypothetical protein